MHNGKITYMPQIQALRGFAALCVVFTHAFLGAGWMNLNAGLNNHPQIGEFGVDIFFVISGFIMVMVSRNDFGKRGAQWSFLKKRLKRIVPLYWLLTCVLIAIVVFAPSLIAHPEIDFEYWAKSLLFIPAEHPVEDGTRPLLVVGWTLQYEMFFYVLFAVSMFFSRTFGLSLLIVALVSIVIIGLFGEPQNLVVEFYSEPIILEFVAGIFIGILYFRGSRIPARYKLVLPAIALVLVVIGWRISVTMEIDRVLFFGLPATLLLAGFTLSKGADKWVFGQLWQRLGDSSYALYLSHVFVVAALGFVFVQLGSPDWQQNWLVGIAFVIMSLIFSCVAGWWVHTLFEVPLGRILGSKSNNIEHPESIRSNVATVRQQ